MTVRYKLSLAEGEICDHVFLFGVQFLSFSCSILRKSLQSNRLAHSLLQRSKLANSIVYDLFVIPGYFEVNRWYND